MKSRFSHHVMTWHFMISDSVVSRFLGQVVLVQVGNTWGSGVIISPTRGIVLTCSHVLKGSKHIPGMCM